MAARRSPLDRQGLAPQTRGMASTRDADAADDELAAVVARRDQSGRALAAGRAAFEGLYDRHAGPVLAFLAARSRRAEVDDLAQEVWRRAWHHLPDGYGGGQFRGWLFRMAR